MNTKFTHKRSNILSRTFTSIILYRDFRFFWMGSWSEHMGEWMETTALLWLMNQMTNSPLMGTLTVTLRYLPMVAFAFVGGILADRINRRFLLICALGSSGLMSIGLAVLAHMGIIQPWHILVNSVLAGIATSFNHPARATLLPNLVKREHLLNAITVDNASVTVSRILGAPLAGLIISFAGTVPVLGVRALGNVLSILWLSKVNVPSTPPGARQQSPLQNFTEGMQYVGQHKGVLTQVLLYLLPPFVTNSYTGLLPNLATNQLHVGAELYGLMNAAPGAGALVATTFLAYQASVRRRGLVLLLGGIAQGLGLIFFAFSPVYALSLMLLVVIGGANNVFMSLNNTIIQEMVADKMRGRVMSLREVSFGLGPSGSLISGVIAGTLGVSLALGFAGAVSVTVLVSILLAIPRVRERG